MAEVRKIWDSAPHNAFTDLIRFKGSWYSVFREGANHVSPDGKLRVITSKNGRDWRSAALLASSTGDLRDAKITITPDHRLMLTGASALHQPAPARHQSLVWFSSDGVRWSEPEAIGDPDFWLWRTTWHKGVAYSFGYNTNQDRNKRTIRLYRSTDGVRYETLLADAGVENSPGEHSLVFRKDGAAVCLLRRDPYRGTPPILPEQATALAGIARPPYTNWTWKDLKTRIGGPHLLELPGGRLVAAVRLHHPEPRTALAYLDPKAGTLQEFLPLPSGGDSSYAGLVWHNRLLWVSYYSSHEGKTSIYLAKVELP